MASNTVTAAVKVSIESKEYKAAMREINKENREFKKQQREAMKQAKLDAQEGFGGVIALAKKMAPAISAGAAALKVAQTALAENQRFTDEWARVTESAKASYESFVDSLVNADFTGFFTRIDEVIARAKEAADAMDTLDTTKIFNDVALAQANRDINRYQSIIRLGTPEEIKAAQQGYEETLKEMQNISRSSSSANLNAFASLLAEYVTTKGFSVSAADFVEKNAEGYYEKRKGTLYDKYYGNLDNYMKWDAIYKAEKALRENSRAKQNQEVAEGGVGLLSASIFNKIRGGSAKGMSDAEYNELKAFFELSDPKLQEAFNLLKQAWADESAVYRAQTQSARYMKVGSGSGTGGGKSATEIFPKGSIGDIRKQIAELTKELEAETDAWMMQALRERINALTTYVKDMETIGQSRTLGAVLSEGVGLQGIDSFRKLKTTDLKPLSTVPLEQTEANEDLTKSGETAASSIMLVSDTLQQLGIMSGIADDGLRKTMNIIGRFLGMAGGFIGGPAGMALQGVGSLVGSFSGGGIVGGTSYTGDRLTARVNSGEMILNASQQRGLFQILNGGSSAGGGSSVVRGEDIYVSLRNYGRRTGKLILP